MAHPKGGSGNKFRTKHTFAQAYSMVGEKGLSFRSTTGEKISASQGLAGDGETATIVFVGERNRHGNVCRACWGYRLACTQTRIGQCVEGLDSFIAGKPIE